MNQLGYFLILEIFFFDNIQKTDAVAKFIKDDLENKIEFPPPLYKSKSDGHLRPLGYCNKD